MKKALQLKLSFFTACAIAVTVLILSLSLANSTALSKDHYESDYANDTGGENYLNPFDTDSLAFETDTQTVISTDTSGGIVILPDEALYGDVNCDTLVNMQDVTSLQKIKASFLTHDNFGESSEQNSDCNRDGKINMLDVTLIQKYLAKLVSF